MCNQNIISNKFRFNPDNNAFFILVYSDFYEIPLPALRFEKVEETDTKVQRHRRERRLPNSTTSKRQKKMTLKEKKK